MLHSKPIEHGIEGWFCKVHDGAGNVTLSSLFWGTSYVGFKLFRNLLKSIWYVVFAPIFGYYALIYEISRLLTWKYKIIIFTYSLYLLYINYNLNNK